MMPMSGSCLVVFGDKLMILGGHTADGRLIPYGWSANMTEIKAGTGTKYKRFNLPNKMGLAKMGCTTDFVKTGKDTQVKNDVRKY